MLRRRQGDWTLYLPQRNLHDRDQGCRSQARRFCRQVKADGLQFYQETESGFKAIIAPWAQGQVVALKLFERSQDENPYLTGNFVIESIEQNAPAGEDATYNVTFSNDGAVTVDATKIDLIATAQE